MKCTKINLTVQSHLDNLLQQYPAIMPIVQAIAKQGGRALLVGGAVRDLLMDLPVKDLDIEVHGLHPEKLESILRMHGGVNFVGKSFGVYKFFHPQSPDVDFSLPRVDASGRKPEVVIDPFMSLERAFARRDLTMNAMGIDLMTRELIDPFGGHEDLQKNILRAVDEQFFIEDPLRFFRVMQFIGRFDMTPDAQLNQICATIDIATVSVERIEKEFEKMLLKSQFPSRGIRWLRTINRLQEVLPEVAATVGIEQSAQWHPEGDVFEHSMQCLDAAARFEYEEESSKLIIMYAALCHDIGKATTTKKEADGKITSYAHAQVGAKMTAHLLPRITRKKDIIAAVVKLVDVHMIPLQLVADGSKPAAYKRLAHKLAPNVTMLMLADLALVDRQGRSPEGHIPLNGAEEDVDAFVRNAAAVEVLEQEEEPVLLGRDLLAIGIQPGPEMGKILARAYEIQIEEGIRDKDALIKRVANHAP